MAARVESQMTSLFDQAVQTLGDAFKAGVKIQEEVARWWSDMLDQSGPIQEFQLRSRAMVNEALPAAQKNAEEWLRIMEQNYRRGMELMKKALESDGPSSGKDMQTRTRELWEASLEAVRDNAQAVAKANVGMVEMWGEIIRKNLGAPAIKAAAARAAK